jgi:hypothetical protein
MSKQRRDSLARHGWFPIKTYNQSIHALELGRVIEVRRRMVEWKKGLYYRFTDRGLARQRRRVPKALRLSAAFVLKSSAHPLLEALRGVYADYLHKTWIQPLVLADGKAFKPLGEPRRKLGRTRGQAVS